MKKKHIQGNVRTKPNKMFKLYWIFILIEIPHVMLDVNSGTCQGITYNYLSDQIDNVSTEFRFTIYIFTSQFDSLKDKLY